jgi:hypothetical protein
VKEKLHAFAKWLCFLRSYDPKNGAANSMGYVGSGMESTEQTVTVTAKTSNKNDNNIIGFPTLAQRQWFANVVFTVSEFNRATFRLTNGASSGNLFSPKYYSSGWGGGSRARIRTFKISNLAKTAGKASFGVSLLIDGYGVYKYYSAGANDPDAVHPGKKVSVSFLCHLKHTPPPLVASWF